MNSTEHPRAQLSAYLDGALGEPERRAVEGHLGSCADCRTRLGELRATASLIRSLPDPVPSRRLVPRLSAPPVWLAPLRTLTTLASGLSVFVFLATALLANVGGLATSSATTAAAPAAAPAQAAAPTVGAGPSAARGATSATTAPSSLSNADAAKQTTTATPAAAAFSVTPTPPSAGAPEAAAQRSDRAAPQVFASPWLWLGLAIVTGIAALALQRRLRSA